MMARVESASRTHGVFQDRIEFGLAVNDSDRDLINEIKAGGREPFERFVQAYRRRLFNFIYRQLGDIQAAEDVLQETFIKVYYGAPEFQERPDARVSTWVFKIAYNLCQNERRRRRRFFLFLQRFHKETEERSQVFHENPDDWDGLGEKARVLFDRLPEKQRAALLLRVNEDLSYQEISRVLGTSVSSIESLLFRARRRLKKCLEQIRGED
ncbi:MAG: RNA polymerase sigma factor [Pseudomonadota bacterium]